MWSIRSARCPQAVLSRDSARPLIGPGRIGRNQRGGIGRRCARSGVVGKRRDPAVPESSRARSTSSPSEPGFQPRRPPGGAAHRLPGRSGFRIVLAEPSVLDQPPQPDLRIGVHDHHQREHRRHGDSTSGRMSSTITASSAAAAINSDRRRATSGCTMPLRFAACLRR